MRNQHTPGPWVYGPDIEAFLAGEAVIPQVIQSTSKQFSMQPHIAAIGGLIQSTEEIEANACLIAAAPDMLVELKQALYIYEQNGFDDHAERLRLLINRIEGGSK